MDIDSVVESVGTAIEAFGVAMIALGAVIATIAFLLRTQKKDPDLPGSYRAYRHNLGRAILLGLEFLVAGDIIRTVAVEPTFRSLGILAGIVAIRTFLSVSLEMEVEGRWPWQRHTDTG